MTFSRYQIVYPKTTTRFKYFVNAYIWILLVCSYLPYQTILPCFVNTDDDEVSNANNITAGYIFMICYLCYNIWFANMFWKALNEKNTVVNSNKRMRFLGYKNLVYSFIR